VLIQSKRVLGPRIITNDDFLIEIAPWSPRITRIYRESDESRARSKSLIELE